MFFLDPKNDVAFKKIFGDDHRKNLTIKLLNGLLEREEGELITDISFKDTANLPEVMDGKKSFVDISCIDQAKNNYIIEMQVVNEFNFLERAQYYAACCLVRQLKKKAKYQKLMPVIFIGIVNHELFGDQENMISHHVITSRSSGRVELDLFQFHFVELHKFNKLIDELKNDIDRLLFFMQNADAYEQIPKQLQNDEDIVEAFHVLERSQWTNLEFEDYIKQQEQIDREQRQRDGFRAEGFEEGTQKKSQELVINLINMGMDYDFIAQATDLTIKEIEAIVQQLHNRKN